MALNTTDETAFPDWQILLPVSLGGLPSSPSLLHVSLKGQSWAELQQPGRLFCIAAQGCVRQREIATY